MTDTELEALLKATEGHTEGPWEVRAFAPEGRQFLDVHEVSGRPVAAVVLTLRQEANARLIAAAPTLRAEVVRLRAQLRDAAKRYAEAEAKHLGLLEELAQGPSLHARDTSGERNVARTQWLLGLRARARAAIRGTEVKP